MFPVDLPRSNIKGEVWLSPEFATNKLETKAGKLNKVQNHKSSQS